MIQSFADEWSEELFHGIHTHHERKTFSSDVVKEAQRMFDILNAADNMEFLKLIPSIHAEAAVRDAKDKYSIPVNAEWRIAFRWRGEHAEDVEIKK